MHVRIATAPSRPGDGRATAALAAAAPAGEASFQVLDLPSKKIDTPFIAWFKVYECESPFSSPQARPHSWYRRDALPLLPRASLP